MDALADFDAPLRSGLPVRKHGLKQRFIRALDPFIQLVLCF
jgi:hypothetical protein